MNSFPDILRTEIRLTMRDFFTVSFALVFPSLMLLIFGSIFGSYPGQAGETMLDDMTPAYSCMIMGVTGLMGFPLTLTANLEHGVYRRFDACPAGRLRIIWGELAASLILTFAGLAILFTFAWAVFGVVPRGSWLVIAASALLATASFFSLGFLLVAAAPGPRAALTLCYAVYFIALFLSGATLPALLFNDTLRTVSDWLPATYAVRLMQAAFTHAEAGREILVLAVATAISISLGGLLFRRRI